MNQWTVIFAPLLGRILLGGFFLWSGIQKALNFPGFVDFFIRAGYPYPLFFAVGIIAIEVTCAIALVADVQSRAAATALAVYLVVASILFSRIATATDVHIFLQNIAIVGGLLMSVGYGSNRWMPGLRR